MCSGVGLDRRRVGGLVAALGEQLGEADDRVERRAQLVAHRREEVALGRARCLELGDQPLALDDECLALGRANGALEQEPDQLQVVLEEQRVRTEVQLEATAGQRVESNASVTTREPFAGAPARRAVDDDLDRGGARARGRRPLQELPDALDRRRRRAARSGRG